MSRATAHFEVGRALGEKLRDHLLPYQWAWVADPSDCMIAEKSRRVGWTYAEALRAVIDRCRTTRDYWFSSSDETAGYEFINEYVRMWADLVGSAAKIVDRDSWRDRDTGQKCYMVQFPTGARITALSSNPKQFNSKGGDATLDEFSKHEQAQRLWDAAQPSTTWGGRLAVFSTHDGEGTLFDQLCREARKVHAGELDPIRDGVPPWSYHRCDIEQAVAQGLAEKIAHAKGELADPRVADPAVRQRFLAECRARARSQATYDQEYMCKPSGESAVLLTYDLIRACSVPADELLGRWGGGHLYGGFDIGREHDLSALAVGEDASRTLMTRHIETWQGTPYSIQRQAVEDLWQAHPIRRFCGDASGIGDMLVESLAEHHGSQVEKIKFTAEVKEDLALRLRERFEDGTIRVPDDDRVRNHLHAVRKQTTKAGNIRYDATRDKEGHADLFWALALMVHAAGGPTREPMVTVL